MGTASIVASLHYLALGIGLGAIFIRGIGLRQLREFRPERWDLKTVFASDGVWGLAAVLWIVTGLARAFGGLEKGTAYYLQNPWFHAKLGLFVLVCVMELWPMVTFIRWRVSRKRNVELPGAGNLEKLIRVNDFETALIVIIPFVASAMARGN